MKDVVKPIAIPEDQEKQALYEGVESRLRGLLAGESDRVARMAGVAAVLHDQMPHFFWTGFYRVIGEELVIGPYQGTPGCSRIARGRGVCGTAWEAAQTQVVVDVHAFPGHIACDAASESEIVVPVKDWSGRVIAVLDVDSSLPGAFGPVDAAALESIVSMFVSPPGGMC